MPNQATDHLTDLETQLEDLQKQPPQNPVFSLDEFTEVDVGEYAYEEEEYETTISTPLDVGPSSSSPSPAIVSPHLGAQRTRRLSSDAGGVEPIEPFPRIQWSIDASDEMIFHWVCSRRFNEQPLPQQRKSWAVKWNIFYWGAFLVTLLSLWLGREFHIALEQGGPVCAKERRREYEVRVHWIYTTSGAMLWVLVRSGLAIAYHRAVHKKVEWVQLGVSWVLVVCYCTGNAVFLRMMRKRNLVGTRSLIVCNAVFSVCMLAALISYAVDVWAHEVSGDMKTIDAAYQAYVLFEKTCAVAFFLLATGVYCKLWSIYRYQVESTPPTHTSPTRHRTQLCFEFFTPLGAVLKS